MWSHPSWPSPGPLASLQTRQEHPSLPGSPSAGKARSPSWGPSLWQVAGSRSMGSWEPPAPCASEGISSLQPALGCGKTLLPGDPNQGGTGLPANPEWTPRDIATHSCIRPIWPVLTMTRSISAHGVWERPAGSQRGRSQQGSRKPRSMACLYLLRSRDPAHALPPLEI